DGRGNRAKRFGNFAVAEDPEPGLWPYRLDEDAHRAAAWHSRAQHLVVEIEIDNRRLAGFEAVERAVRDRAFGAAAADPARENPAVAADHRFGAGLRRDRAVRLDDGRKHERLSALARGKHGVEHVARGKGRRGCRQVPNFPWSHGSTVLVQRDVLPRRWLQRRSFASACRTRPVCEFALAQRRGGRGVPIFIIESGFGRQAWPDGGSRAGGPSCRIAAIPGSARAMRMRGSKTGSMPLPRRASPRAIRRVGRPWSGSAVPLAA